MSIVDEIRDVMKVESQKALGLVDLIERGFPCPSSTFITRDTDRNLKARFLRSKTQMDGQSLYFLRPCPKVPRHGVLESIKFRNDEGADEMLHKFLDHMIESGEDSPVVVIQPFIRAKLSGIIDKDSITIGLDHDGVTAGRGVTVSFPLPEGVIPSWVGQVEFIAPEDKSFHVLFTQNRAVPEGTDGLDMALPEGAVKGFANGSRVQIKSTFITTGLQDAQKIESMDLDGVAVIHVGGNSASHIAVHCRNFRGSVYLPVEDSVQARRVSYAVLGLYAVNVARNGLLLTEDPDSVPAHLPPVLGVDRAEVASKVLAFSNPSQIPTMLWAAPALKMPPVNDRVAYLQGVTTGVYLKASALACLGEARHFSSVVGVARENGLHVYQWLGVPSARREDVYSNVVTGGVTWESDHKSELDKLLEAVSLTEHLFAGYHWGSSYGGKRWADIARAVIKGIRSLLENDFEGAMRVANQLELITHNGGRTGIEKFAFPIDRNLLWGWGTDFLRRGSTADALVNYVRLAIGCTSMIPEMHLPPAPSVKQDLCLYKGLDTFIKTCKAFRDHETWMYKAGSKAQAEVHPVVAFVPSNLEVHVNNLKEHFYGGHGHDVQPITLTTANTATSDE